MLRDREVANDGSWTSLRQNLPPIVENGASSIGRYPGTYWGDNFHHVETDYRSAICTREDNRLMYVAMSYTRVRDFAAELVHMGCRLAMQLDITAPRPQFVWYSGLGTSTRSGTLLHPLMQNPGRYLRYSQMNFVALFDPTASAAAG